MKDKKQNLSIQFIIMFLLFPVFCFCFLLFSFFHITFKSRKKIEVSFIWKNELTNIRKCYGWSQKFQRGCTNGKFQLVS